MILTTDIDKIDRRNFLSFQTLAIFNSILSNNLSIHNQFNINALWTYLQTLMEIPGSILVFANY